MVTSLLATADLTSAIPENTRRLADKVSLNNCTVDTRMHSVFYVEACPPPGHFSKGVVVLLHGQSFSSSTWTEHSTMQLLAAGGYRCIAPDLPGGGRTRGPSIPVEDRPVFFKELRQHLNLKEVMVVAASMASPYVLPLLGSPWMQCFLAMAPSNTHSLGETVTARTPVLVVYGEKDTSLVLPNCRSIRVPSAGHAVHLGNPFFFQSVCLNFFDLIRSYTPN